MTVPGASGGLWRDGVDRRGLCRRLEEVAGAVVDREQCLDPGPQVRGHRHRRDRGRRRVPYGESRSRASLKMANGLERWRSVRAWNQLPVFGAPKVYAPFRPEVRQADRRFFLSTAVCRPPSMAWSSQARA